MKSAYQNQIIDKIRLIRLQKGYSQNQIATIIGISSGQMGNIESPNRSHKYTLSQLSMICHEFNIGIEELFLESSDQMSKSETINRLINCIIEYEK